jgi:predicted nucleic acid-binding protein
MDFSRIYPARLASLDTPWTARMRMQWWRWCNDLGLQGNDVNDAYLAATAAQVPCRLVSRDGGFARFPGLDWWNPVPKPSAERPQGAE